MNRNHFLSGKRQGKIALMTALMLVALIGILACALDLGWIAMTKTQLQAAADSASLAGGTELLPGLGFHATKTPTEVRDAVEIQSVAFAAANRAGDYSSVYIDAGRDIQLGTCKLNTGTNQWEFNWGDTPYNAVQVTPKRNVHGGGMDRPLPLFFAPVLGTSDSSISVLSAAIILPASRFTNPPNGGNSSLMPFAFEEKLWDKYFRALEHYQNTLGGDASLIDISYLDIDGSPLYFQYYMQGANQKSFQLFNDVLGAGPGDTVVNAPDDVLEFSIFPIDQTSGNFGTIDIGSLGNSAADLKRQIADGPSPADMAYFPDSTITPPLDMNGDTGVSAGISSTLESIIGQCRAIALFDTVSGPGNNANFHVVDIVGVRIMDVKLSGSNKYLTLQPCKFIDPGGVPDPGGTPGPRTTIFSPLILAQ